MAPTEDQALARALGAVATALANESDVTALISRTCQLAVETIDPCQHADVMVVGPKRTLLVPGTTDWVGTRVVSIEDETGEGPCIDAYETRAVIESPDLTAETRWPKFIPRCLRETPVRSGLGLPLLMGDTPIGSLDLYAQTSNVFTEEDVAAAALFASHAAVALVAARAREQFHEALESRDIIGQAKGILMAQSHINADAAFDLLRRASQRLNVKLAQVAQDIVDENAED